MADYASDLLSTLNSAGLSTLATTISNVASSHEGKRLVDLLSMTDKRFTLFAPTNDAFSAAFPKGLSGVSNQTLAETLSYHMVSGALDDTIVNYPDWVIGRTYLNASDLVKLEGNKSQVLEWSQFGDNDVHVPGQPNSTVVVSQTSWSNLNINAVDHVLTPPGSLADALKSEDLSVLESIFKTVPGLFDTLNTHAQGFTFFAPNDRALKAALGNATVSRLLSNQTVLATVLANHIVNGTTIYSPFLSAEVISAAGEKISGELNDTGAYISSGSSTARVTSVDVFLRNGVVHVINGLFLNAESNPSAASSAFQSATSAVGIAPSTTETAPIGPSTVSSQSGSGSSPTSGSSGAVSLGCSKSTVAVLLLGAFTGGLMPLF